MILLTPQDFTEEDIDLVYAAIRDGECEPPDRREEAISVLRALADAGRLQPQPDADELERLRKFAHQHAMHPDYEYETTHGPRKAWDSDTKPEGEGWERNVHQGYDNGWARFDYHEESYWMRRKVGSTPEESREDHE